MKRTIENALNEVQNEVVRAKELHPGEFHNLHEGYAVLLEEVRELENGVFFGLKPCKAEAASSYYQLEGHNASPEIANEEIKKMAIKKHKDKIREEAVQVAAMAIRIITELT